MSRLEEKIGPAMYLWIGGDLMGSPPRLEILKPY